MRCFRFFALFLVIFLCCDATKDHRTRTRTQTSRVRDKVKSKISSTIHRITAPKKPKTRHSVSDDGSDDTTSAHRKSSTSKRPNTKEILKTVAALKKLKKSMKKFQDKKKKRSYYYGERNYRSESHVGQHCVYQLSVENYIVVEDSSSSSQSIEDFRSQLKSILESSGPDDVRSMTTTPRPRALNFIRTLHFTCPRTTRCCELDCCAIHYSGGSAAGPSATLLLTLLICFTLKAVLFY